MKTKKINKKDLVLGETYLIPDAEYKMIFVYRDEGDYIYFYPTSKQTYYDEEEDGTIRFYNPAIYEEVE